MQIQYKQKTNKLQSFQQQDFQQYDKFGSHMDFGDTVEGKSLYFVKIIDFNHNVLEIPFNSKKDPLSKLIKSYNQIKSQNLSHKKIYLKNSRKNKIYHNNILIESIFADFQHQQIQVTYDDPSNQKQQDQYLYNQACIQIKGNVKQQAIDQGNIHVPIGKQSFSIFIKTQKNQTLQLPYCSSQHSIEMIKQKIKDKLKIHRQMQKLIFVGLKLDGNRFLSDYQIGPGSALNLVKAYYPMPLKTDILTLHIKTIKGTILQLQASPYDTVKQLKIKIQTNQKIRVNQQKLMYGGIQLKDENKLIQQGVQNQSRIFVVIKMQGGCFKESCQILGQNDKLILISQIKKGDKIKSWNLQKNEFQDDQVTNVYSCKVKKSIKIICENKIQVQCTPNHLFYIGNQEWASYQFDQINKILNQGDKIMSTKGETKVKTVQFIQKEDEQIFYHISVLKIHNFIVNGLIAHNMKLFMLHKSKIFELNLAPTQTIKAFKQHCVKSNVVKFKTIQDFQIKYAGMILQNHKTWKDLNIPKDSYVELISKANLENEMKMQNINNTIILMRFSETQLIKTSYQDIRDLLVHQIIAQFHNSPKSYYSFLFGSQILYPFEKLNKIQTKPFFKGSQCTLILIKNTQKIIFNQILPTYHEFPSKKFPLPPKAQKLRLQSERLIKQKVSDKQLSKQSFYYPIQYYTCNIYYRKLNQYLNNLQLNGNHEELKQNDLIKFTSSLVSSLKKLPNYFGLVHRGIKNFVFSSQYKVGDSFYWRSFTSTSIRQDVAVNFKNSKGTIFHIKSLTGKKLEYFSIYQQQKQVLFLPFTYFIVQKIEKNGQSDQVWMTEMPTPFVFQKNLVLWVDDTPQNNFKYLPEMNKTADVLMLTSTKMAKIWVKQFGWLMSFLKKRFRIISDMVRAQEQSINYSAGIDLLEKLIGQGFTIPVLIFCSDLAKAQKNIDDRSIKYKGYFRVTNSQKQVQEYANFRIEADEQKYIKSEEGEIDFAQVLQNGQKLPIKGCCIIM